MLKSEYKHMLKSKTAGIDYRIHPAVNSVDYLLEFSQFVHFGVDA